MARRYPRNPYRFEGISDEEFKVELIADRKLRKKLYGSSNIIR